MTDINKADTSIVVVHPMFDVPEEKRDGEGLGLMKMDPCVKYALMALRFYLIAMMILLGYHVLDLAVRK